MFDNVQNSGLSKSQLALVKRIHEKTGILCVRDKQTFKDSRAQPYGTEFTPVTTNVFGGSRADNTSRRKRVIEIHWRDSDAFPGGIPIGTTQLFRVSQTEGMGPDRSFRFVGVKYDIIQDEMKQLRALAYDRTWMSQEERRKDERAKAKRRARAKDQDMTLSESIGQEIAKGLKEAVKVIAAPGKAAE